VCNEVGSRWVNRRGDAKGRLWDGRLKVGGGADGEAGRASAEARAVLLVRLGECLRSAAVFRCSARGRDAAARRGRRLRAAVRPGSPLQAAGGSPRATRPGRADRPPEPPPWPSSWRPSIGGAPTARWGPWSSVARDISARQKPLHSTEGRCDADAGHLSFVRRRRLGVTAETAPFRALRNSDRRRSYGCIQAKAEASAELEQAARSTSVGRTVERGSVASALIERLERRADTEGRRS
jgi:hypothetical protein